MANWFRQISPLKIVLSSFLVIIFIVVGWVYFALKTYPISIRNQTGYELTNLSVRLRTNEINVKQFLDGANIQLSEQPRPKDDDFLIVTFHYQGKDYTFDLGYYMAGQKADYELVVQNGKFICLKKE